MPSSSSFSEIFSQFAKIAPSSVMIRAILERVFAPQRLDAIFLRHAKRQYVRELLFSTIVKLMMLVVLRLRKSVNSAYPAVQDEIGVSLKAVYEKINRLEPDIGAGLVRETAAEMTRVVRNMNGGLTPLLPGRRVLFLDGNCRAGTERRIFELRDVQAAPLPGKTLAILDQQTGLIIDLVPCEDGHAQERSLLDRTLEKIEPNDVWTGDRNFCTVGFLSGLAARKACFVIRRHKNLPCRTVGLRKLVRHMSDGTKVYEQGLVLETADGETLLARQVTVRRQNPTRDGEYKIEIVTNVPASEADATKIATIYARRWGLENAFQKLTEVLRCEVETLGYPKAALFAFSVAVTAYNAVVTLEGGLRAVHGEEKIKAELSLYHLCEEISFMYGGVARLTPESDWNTLRQMKDAEFANYLLQLAQAVDLSLMRKAKRGVKKPVTPKTRYRNTPHVSTAKLLRARRK